MAQVGINIRMYEGSSPVSMSSPETCALVSGKTYQIVDTAKRILRSPDTVPTWADVSTVVWDDVPYETWKDLTPWFRVYDGGTTSSDRVDPDDIAGADFLNGTVTFVSGYSVTGTVYIETDYIPITTLVKATTLDINESVDLAEKVTFGTAETDVETNGLNPSRRKQVQLSYLDGEIGGFYDFSDNFTTALRESSFLYIKVYPDIVNQSGNYITIKALIDSESKDFSVEDENEFSVSWQSHEPYSEVVV